MTLRSRLKQASLFLVICILIFADFSVVPSVFAEEKDFQTVYATDFGDSEPLEEENWGFSTYAASLSIHKENISGNNTAKLDFSIVDQSGGRVATKAFDQPVKGEQIQLKLDWYPGKHNDKGSNPTENGGELRLEDEAGNRVFTINHTNNAPLTFYVGNQEPVSTEITEPEAWYDIEISFDLLTNEVDFSIGEESYSASLEQIEFDGSISQLNIAGIRTSGNNHTWTTYLDNLELNHIPVQEHAISSVDRIPYHRVYVGETTEAIDSIGLPDKVTVTLADGSKKEVAVEAWEQTGSEWNPNESGIYTFKGELKESEEHVNPFHRMATIHVYNRLQPPSGERETEWLDRGLIAMPSEQ